MNTFVPYTLKFFNLKGVTVQIIQYMAVYQRLKLLESKLTIETKQKTCFDSYLGQYGNFGYSPPLINVHDVLIMCTFFQYKCDGTKILLVNYKDFCMSKLIYF